MTENYLKYGRKYYEKNKAQVVARARKTNKTGNVRNQRYVWEYLKDKTCELCPFNNPLALTFDHQGGKVMEVSMMAKASYGLETLKREIAKCRIICFNCHMIEANRERNSLKWQWSTSEAATE